MADEREPTADFASPLPDRFDPVCDRFEEAWKEGKQPRIEEYLDEVSEPERAGLLYALLGVELHWRQEKQEQPKREEYYRRFPGQANAIDGAFGRYMDDGTADHIPNPGSGNSYASTQTFRRATQVTNRYRVLYPHRQGGLGLISVAMDQEVNREVAFKELLERHADNPDSQMRFLMEAEITGSLEHPGIVPVYGLGRFANGRPYYAMRFVRGRTLRQAIESHHKSGGSVGKPGHKSLAFRKLLTQFIAVCNTIEYAHSRGVIHRDLKPSNVMLGKYGETLVLDWGLAKAVGRSAETPRGDEATLRPASGSGSAPTHLGSVMGTPAFMCPEQAEGRIDEMGPASDVYSLGAILYCILTGQPPVQGGSQTEILEQVRSGRFPKPRERNPEVAVVLETVCLKAMALKAQDRYKSAGSLAEDVEHWLADEPVSAHRESLSERLGRWTRRHRTWTRAAAAALLLTAIVSVVAAVLVDRARQRAATAAERELAARQEATKRLAQARNAVDTWFTGVGDALRYYPGTEEARERLLQMAAQHYESFAENRSNDADLETERGRTYLRLGDVRRMMGETDKAEEAYVAAASLLGQLAEANPEHLEIRQELANSRIRRGLVLAETMRLEDANKEYESVVPELRTLAREHPTNRRVCYLLGTALSNWAVSLWKSGERQSAEQKLHQALREFEQLRAECPDDAEYQAAIITAQNVLGEIYVADKRYDEAIEPLRGCLAAVGALVKQKPDDPQYVKLRADVRIYLAGVLRLTGRYHEELECYEKAATDYTLLAQAMPDLPGYRADLARARVDAGNLLYELERPREARAQLEQALPLLEQLAKDYTELSVYVEEEAACRDALGRALSDLDDNEAARAEHELAVRTYEEFAKEYGDVPGYREMVAVYRSHLGQVLHKLDDLDGAEEQYRTAITILEGLRNDGPAPQRYCNEMAYVHRHLGELLRDKGRIPESREEFRKARALWEYLVASDVPEYVHNLAWLLANCSDPEVRNPGRAIELAKEAKNQAPRNPQYWRTLGVACYRAGDYQDAISSLREANRRRQEGNPMDRFFLSMAEWQLGKETDARNSFEEAREMMEDKCPGKPETQETYQEACALLGISPPEPKPPNGDVGPQD